MAKLGWVSIKTIIEDYIDHSAHLGVLDETAVLKFANDAVERISTGEQLVHKLTLLEVNNYKAELPEGFKYVGQAAYRLDPPTPTLKEQASQWTQNILGSDCQLEMTIKCPKCSPESCSCDDWFIEVDVDDLYESNHPELYSKYMGHFHSSGSSTKRGGPTSIYDERFRLMRKTSTEFFNVPYHIGDCINIDVDSEIEYNIEPPVMIVNFPKGEVLLSYLGVKTDEEGYRMIPNVEIVFTAINWYIEERMAFRQYRRTKEQKDRIFWQQAMELKEKMIARARSQISTPDPDEFWQFIRNHWKKLLPYYKWDYNGNKFQQDQFKYPQQTYNPSTRKRGY